MKSLAFLRFSLIILLILSVNFESKGQRRLWPYVNAGYVSNFKKSPVNLKADSGGSLRIGVFNKGLFGNGRFGFYAGYLWFNEFHPDYIGYEDRGSVLMGGLDFKLFGKGDFNCYLKLGMGIEKYTTSYPDYRSETENSFKPDMGLLFNFQYFNTYLGWQPSDPAHLNIGVGFTLFKPWISSEPDS